MGPVSFFEKSGFRNPQPSLSLFERGGRCTTRFSLCPTDVSSTIFILCPTDVSSTIFIISSPSAQQMSAAPFSSCMKTIHGQLSTIGFHPKPHHLITSRVCQCRVFHPVY